MLKDLKMLLGIPEEDTDPDTKLNWILTSTRERLKLLLVGMEPPEEMNHIITEVSVIRFNRLGSEGIRSQTVEGESNQYSDNDFDGFRDEIQAFLDSQKDATKGRLRYL